MGIITLDSIRNIRDLGGITNREGKTIKDKCLIRSAQLSFADDSDLDLLYDGYRLREIIDLRTREEIEEAPDNCGKIGYISLPVITSFMDGITHEEREAHQMPDMMRLYEDMMKKEEQIDNFRRIMEHIMDNDFEEKALLWHCSEGKDRCGMVTALVLLALDVEYEKIKEDYLETNTTNIPRAKQFYEQIRKEMDEETAKSYYQAFIADERYLEAAFRSMGENYISNVLKIDKEKIEAFRKKVLI